MESSKHPAPLEIPWQSLSPEALQGILEAFVLREGTDYGQQEVCHEKKTQQLLQQLQKGEIKVVFDATSESVTLMTKKDFSRFAAQEIKDSSF